MLAEVLPLLGPNCRLLLTGTGLDRLPVPPLAATAHQMRALRGLGPGLPGHVQQASSAAGFAACCRDAAPSTPAQRLAVPHWAHHRARLYQQQLQRGLLALAATRPAAQWAGR